MNDLTFKSKFDSDFGKVSHPYVKYYVAIQFVDGRSRRRICEGDLPQCEDKITDQKKSRLFCAVFTKVTKED